MEEPDKTREAKTVAEQGINGETDKGEDEESIWFDAVSTKLGS